TADDLPLSETRQQINNTNDGFLDTYPVDSTKQEPYNEYYARNYQYTHTSPIEDKKERVRKAMVYIISQYGDAIDRDELANIQQYITTFSPRETGIFLADYRLRVRSYFWLTGAMVYAEVICWVIFGVLCSMLFYIGNLVRRGNGNGSNQRNIIYHAARLFYAPFLAVMLVLAYSYLKGGATLHIEASEVIIIFAFLLGFYSGLVQDLLDRLKGNTATTVVNHSYETPIAPQQQFTTKQETPAPAATAQQPAEEQELEEAIIEEVPEPAQQYPPVQQVKPRRKVMNDNNEITEVEIDLKLDFSGLFDEERMQLQRLGFNRAIVTLHNVNGKDIIPAKKLDDDMTTFVATDVKPGIYIARATLSQRLKDDQIINLFGEKTAYITEDKPGLELYVKKYETTD
ncbi:MAG: hypothetical protein KDC07_10800, partial [Chitinophagaceae bacterium]|nr:hypothetical protein [Chitinophagaceae bacterium]